MFTKNVCLFTLKILFVSLVSVILIIFIRFGYCCAVASSSANTMLSTIARYVAEENGLITDDTNASGYTSFDIVAKMLEDCNTVIESDGTTRDNMAFHYYVPTQAQFISTQARLSGKIPAIVVRKVDDEGLAGGINICKKNASGSDNSVVQRGEILEIRVTAYATCDSGFSMPNGGKIVFTHQFTKTMRVPAVTYYRGL